MLPCRVWLVIAALLILFQVFTEQAFGANVVTIQNGEGYSGGEGSVSVHLANDDSLSGLQFTIRDIPDRITVTGVELSPRMSAFSQPSINDIDSLGVVRIVIFAFGASLPPGAGEVLILNLDVAPDTSPGTIDIVVDEVVFSTPGAQNVDASALAGSFTVLPQLVFSEYPAGQVADEFLGIGPGRHALSRFSVTVAEEAATVSSIQFDLSSISGITDGDFTDITLTEDVDNNGKIGPGENGLVGGPGIADVEGDIGTIVFELPFAVGAGSRQYILEADVNITQEATVQVALPDSGIIASAVVAGVLIPANTVSPASHATGSLTLSDHAAVGQVLDRFANLGLYANEVLFRFDTSAGGDVSQLSEIILDVSLSGIDLGNISDWRLYLDLDADGLPDGQPVSLLNEAAVPEIRFSDIELDLAGIPVRSLVVTATVDARSQPGEIAIHLDENGLFASTTNDEVLAGSGTATEARHVAGSVAVTESSGGPLPNQLGASGILANIPVHRFTVLSAGDDVTVESITLDIQFDGLSFDDPSQSVLYQDINGDGVADGDPLATADAPLAPLTPVAASVTFSGLDIPVSANTYRTFLVHMTVDVDSTSALSVTLDSAGVTVVDPAGNAISVSGGPVIASHRPVTLLLLDASTGQIENQFNGVASANGVGLFRFAIASPGDSISLREITFDLTLSGIPAAAIQTPRLYRAGDLDGQPDGSPLVAVADISSGNLKLSGLTEEVGISGTFVLVADVSLNTVGDSLTVGLYGENILTEITSTGYENLLSTAAGTAGVARHGVTGFSGDVTFDLTIDVLDVVKEVAVVLGVDPMEGALSIYDLDGNGNVNIVDVVQIINMALSGDFPVRVTGTENLAEVLLLDQQSRSPVIGVQSDVAIAGIQLDLSIHGVSAEQIGLQSEDTGLRMAQATIDDGTRILFYSERGLFLNPGQNGVVRVEFPPDIPAGASITIDDAIFVGPAGNEIPSTGDSWVWKLADVPATFALNQNYPNPFNPTTTISFDLPKPGHVQLVVYNALGQLVRTLIDDARPAGRHVAKWDGRNEAGKSVASGIYFCQITTDLSFQEIRKMTLMK